MTRIKTKNQALPEETVIALKASRSDKQSFRANIQALAQVGWTGACIGESLGLTRERIRQITKDPEVMGDVTIEVPEAPRVEHKEYSRRVVTMPDPEVLRGLLALKPIAQRARSSNSLGRAESAEYTRLLASELSRGVSVYQLANALGVTNNAIRFRLMRYGYLEPSVNLATNYPNLVKRVVPLG